MKNSYRFYCNKDCQYFPCHEVKNEDDFNCMFCYCPLYLLDDCKEIILITVELRTAQNVLFLTQRVDMTT